MNARMMPAFFTMKSVPVKIVTSKSFDLFTKIIIVAFELAESFNDWRGQSLII